MTLDEKAQKTCHAFVHLGYIRALIEAFREQIEECAKVADAAAAASVKLGQFEDAAHLRGIGNAIRALADPPDNIENPARLWYD